jgi:hypothetical protein
LTGGAQHPWQKSLEGPYIFALFFQPSLRDEDLIRGWDQQQEKVLDWEVRKWFLFDWFLLLWRGKQDLIGYE